MRGWRAALLLTVVLSAGIACGAEGPVNGSPAPAPPVPAAPAVPTAPATVSPSAPTSPPPTSSSPFQPQPREMLRLGDRGPVVLRLQRDLSRLGFWLGTPDGVFGDETQQAVYALQHAADISADGVVGRVTKAVLERGTRPRARTTAGNALEVDVQHQLLLLVVGGRVQAVVHVSTGGEYVYADGGVTSRATTPRGRFRIERKVDGWDHSRLGWLWRPAYFVGGYALHGYVDVPPYPASHGCVRVGMAAMNWLWRIDAVKVGQRVWVY